MRKGEWKPMGVTVVLAAALMGGAGMANAAAGPGDGFVRAEYRRGGDYRREGHHQRYYDYSRGDRHHWQGYPRHHDHYRGHWAPPRRHYRVDHYYYYSAPRYRHYHVHGPYCGHGYHSPYGHLVDFLYEYSYYD